MSSMRALLSNAQLDHFICVADALVQLDRRGVHTRLLQYIDQYGTHEHYGPVLKRLYGTMFGLTWEDAKDRRAHQRYAVGWGPCELDWEATTAHPLGRVVVHFPSWNATGYFSPQDISVHDPRWPVVQTELGTGVQQSDRIVHLPWGTLHRGLPEPSTPSGATWCSLM